MYTVFEANEILRQPELRDVNDKKGKKNPRGEKVVEEIIVPMKRVVPTRRCSFSFHDII